MVCKEFFKSKIMEIIYTLIVLVINILLYYNYTDNIK